MFKKLIERPAYIFKFAIYLLFIGFAFIFYFSNLMEDRQEGNLKMVYTVLLFVYGSYRLLRTYQDFKLEDRNDE